MEIHIHHHHYSVEVQLKLNAIQTQLTQLQKDIKSIMAGITDINSSETTLHNDLAAENGLIKQLLSAFANSSITPAQAQALVDQMNSDDADAKSNIAAITAVLPTTAASGV